MAAGTGAGHDAAHRGNSGRHGAVVQLVVDLVERRPAEAWLSWLLGCADLSSCQGHLRLLGTAADDDSRGAGHLADRVARARLQRLLVVVARAEWPVCRAVVKARGR